MGEPADMVECSCAIGAMTDPEARRLVEPKWHLPSCPAYRQAADDAARAWRERMDERREGR